MNPITRSNPRSLIPRQENSCYTCAKIALFLQSFALMVCGILLTEHEIPKGTFFSHFSTSQLGHITFAAGLFLLVCTAIASVCEARGPQIDLSVDKNFRPKKR